MADMWTVAGAGLVLLSLGVSEGSQESVKRDRGWWLACAGMGVSLVASIAGVSWGWSSIGAVVGLLLAMAVGSPRMTKCVSVGSALLWALSGCAWAWGVAAPVMLGVAPVLMALWLTGLDCRQKVELKRISYYQSRRGGR